MPLPSVLSLLRERAGRQPDDIAFTYTDYEPAPQGLDCVEHYSGDQFIRLDA